MIIHKHAEFSCMYVACMHMHVMGAEIWNACILPGPECVSSRSASPRPLFRLAPDA